MVDTAPISPADPSEQFIAQSPAMQEVARLVQKVARTDVPVLIQGEFGVGKTFVARQIHRQSHRATEPFVCVTCGAIPESELDQKLFGEPQHGAGKSECFLRRSTKGTLFLDEVWQLPPWAQVKLFEVFQHFGAGNAQSRETKPQDPRLIAAAIIEPATARNRDCAYSPLYYCLRAVEIEIPPLRRRPEDIKALAEHFLAAESFAKHSPLDHGQPHLSDEAWQQLRCYDWPGNIPELASLIRRAVALTETLEIRPEHIAELLPKRNAPPAAEMLSVPLTGGLKEMERCIVEDLIRRCQGNKAAAARALGLHRRTLYRLLKKDR